ncbi:hypothetical protein BH24ACT4_BH24ACT4_13150 [soil metagenome]
MPDAAATAVFPPRPNISADAPATTRRCRSSMCGITLPKNRARPFSVTSTPTRYYARTNLAWTLTNAIVCWKAPSDLAQVSTRAGTSLR